MEFEDRWLLKYKTAGLSRSRMDWNGKYKCKPGEGTKPTKTKYSWEWTSLSHNYLEVFWVWYTYTPQSCTCTFSYLFIHWVHSNGCFSYAIILTIQVSILDTIWDIVMYLLRGQTWKWTSQIQLPTPLLTSCVELGNLLQHCRPWFSLLIIRDNIN